MCFNIVARVIFESPTYDRAVLQHVRDDFFPWTNMKCVGGGHNYCAALYSFAREEHSHAYDHGNANEEGVERLCSTMIGAIRYRCK